jgi:REG-2-like HAD superfamily hydrolase
MTLQKRRTLTALSEFAKPTFHALFVDAAGTLLYPREDTAAVYARYGKAYGLDMSEGEILARYRKAYATPWGESTIRYVDDGKPFWRFIVAESTGISDEGMFSDIYDYYSRKEAWTVAAGAKDALVKIRQELGLKTAVVSNFDSRLHQIMEELELTSLFDAIIVSADCAAEKPNPILFTRACEALHVLPEHVVHVGDDRRNDVKGARDAGCYAWLWGDDVMSFDHVLRRIETGNLIDSLEDPI